MDGDPGDLLRLLLQRKQDIDLIAQKGLDAVFIPEYGRDLNVAVCLRKKPYGFREKIYGLPDHEADGDAVPVGRAEILPLLDGAFQILPHAGQERDKLRSGRRQRRALSAALKDRDIHKVCLRFFAFIATKKSSQIPLAPFNHRLLLFKN